MLLPVFPPVPVRYRPRKQCDALVLALDQAFIQLLRRYPLVIAVSISAVRLDRKGCINDHRPWRSIDHEIQGSLTLCRRVVGLHYHIEFVARGSRVDLQPGAGRNIGVAQHLPGRWRQSGGQEHDVKVRIKLPQLGAARRQPLEIGTETATTDFHNMGLYDKEMKQVTVQADVFGDWRRRRFTYQKDD